MTSMAEFIARENIRRFKVQLLDAAEGNRKNIIRGLLEVEEDHLRNSLHGQEHPEP